MRFEEALKYLRQGKKVRRKSWFPKCCICKKGGGIFYYDGCIFYISEDIMNNDDWELYEEPILDEKEKEYLSAVIKPFRDRVKYITKQGMSDSEKEHICIFTDQWITDLPMFKQGTMYKGMNLDEQYTLKELGL